jgi:NADPH:quinone reductase-like Zn-dependent oxidoreductase
MSLVKHGGNARFTKIDAERLVKVPGNLEPCEVVCLAETYLSAFQALHCGQRMATRYMRNSLSGKSIFVLGALTNVGRAVIELAEAGGATLIYAPCKAKYKERVRSLGATPLSPYKDEWMPLLHKKLDLIIDATIDTSEELENCFSILGEKGDYIFIGRTQKEIDRVTAVWVGSSNVVCSSKKVRMMNRIHAYDVFETWETNLESGKVRQSQRSSSLE